ncbi:hypothetical protein AA313_de0203293 [Arthrobotrys entomopaga]|nr:hypothetical protein AA313_de0203293 [Arthrobotrys entomopaga]
MANCLLIPEILEMVLINIPPIQVITTRRVCKTWASLINTSPTLKSYTTTGLSLNETQIPKQRFTNDYGGGWYFPRSPVTPLAKSILDRIWTKILPDALQAWNRPTDQTPDQLVEDGEERDIEEYEYENPCTYTFKVGCYQPLDPPVEVRKLQMRYPGEVKYYDCDGMQKDY